MVSLIDFERFIPFFKQHETECKFDYQKQFFSDFDFSGMEKYSSKVCSVPLMNDGTRDLKI